MAKMKLDNLLKQHRFNQKDLADYTGINKNTISRYVNNTFEKIDKGHLDLLCDFFKCTLNELFELEPVQQKMFPPSEINDWMDISKTNAVGHEYNKTWKTPYSHYNSNMHVNDIEREYQSLIEDQKQKEDKDYIENKKEIDEISINYQARFLAELRTDKSVSDFLNKIVEMYLSSSKADDDIKQVFKKYNKHSLFETKTKVEKFYKILNPFLSYYSNDIALNGILTQVYYIYTHGELDKLSNEELDKLEDTLIYYLNNAQETKQKTR